MNRPYLSRGEKGDWLIAVKATPGARNDQIVGVLGDRLKIRIAAPPEGGKANKAICALLADAINCKPRDLDVASGAASPEKTIRARGVSLSALENLPE